jgi:hypothetical protein
LEGLHAEEDDDQVPDEPEARPAFRLASLHAYAYAQLKPEFLNFILHNSHASLTSLDIPSKSAEGQAWDLSPFVALQFLELVLQTGQPIDEGSDQDKGVCYTVNTCRALLSLKLESIARVLDFG